MLDNLSLEESQLAPDVAQILAEAMPAGSRDGASSGVTVVSHVADLERWEHGLAQAEANAQIAYLQTSMSILSALGAELATALEKRNQEYEKLRLKAVTLLPDLTEVAAASHRGATQEQAKPDAWLPAEVATLRGQVEAARSELTATVEQRDLWAAQLRQRETELDQLRTLLTALQADLLTLQSMRADVEEQLNSRTHELDERQAHVGVLERDLDSARANSADLAFQLSGREAELDELRNQLDALQASLDTVHTGKSDLEAQLQSRHTEMAGLQAQFEATQATLRSADTRNEELDSQLHARDLQLGRLEEQLAILNSDLASLTAEKEEVIHQLQARDAELGDLTTRLAALQADIKAAVDDPNSATRSIALPLGGEVAGAGDDAIRAVEAAADAGEPDQAGNRVTVQHAADSLGLGVKLALSRLKQKDEERITALGEIDVLHAQIAAHAAAQSELKDKLASLDQAMGQAQEQVAATESKLAERTVEVDTLNATVADLQTRLDDALAAKLQLEERIAQRESAQEALTKQLAETQEQGQGLQASLDMSSAEAADLRTKIAEAQAGLNDVTAAKADLETLLQQRESEMAELTAQLAAAHEESEKSLGAKVAEIAALTAGAAAAAEAIQQKNDELTGAQSRVAELEQQLEALGQSKAELEIELRQRTADWETLSTTLSAEIEALQTREAQLAAAQDSLVIETAWTQRVPAFAEFAKAFADLPPAKNHAVNEAVRAGTLPPLSHHPQDLSQVEGIGSIFEQRLYKAGVGTYWELANLTDEEMRRFLSLTDWRLLSMDFAEIRADALRLAQETGTVGHVWEVSELDDFEPLVGIGTIYEQRLYDAGIYTYEALAGLTVEQLNAICHAPKLNPPQYHRWIEQAKDLAQRRTQQG